LVRALDLIAKEKGVTTAQLAIAWVLYCGDDVIPLIGARNRQRLQESVSALDLTLSGEDLARLRPITRTGKPKSRLAVAFVT
jgi:aryl-alcohol dehydrogenase-like predicted oxidoreductase